MSMCSRVRVLVGAVSTALVILAGSGRASAYEVVEIADAGTITGTILLQGKAQAPKIFKVEKTPEVCGEDDRVLDEVRVNGDGRLADVVLALRGVEAGKPYSELTLHGPPPGGRELTQTDSAEYPGTRIRPENCTFGAFTGVIADGTFFRFDNQDPVKHSPHGYSIAGRVRNSMFNTDLEGNSTLEMESVFERPNEIAVKIECDQHNHMQNWFLRVDNPYFAFSAADGTFTIEGVPPGTYTLTAWHPRFTRALEEELVIESNGTVTAEFSFRSRVR